MAGSLCEPSVRPLIGEIRWQAFSDMCHSFKEHCQLKSCVAGQQGNFKEAPGVTMQQDRNPGALRRVKGCQHSIHKGISWDGQLATVFVESDYRL